MVSALVDYEEEDVEEEKEEEQTGDNRPHRAIAFTQLRCIANITLIVLKADQLARRHLPCLSDAAPSLLSSHLWQSENAGETIIPLIPSQDTLFLASIIPANDSKGSMQ